MKRNLRGFTLIELMMTLAIISVLAAAAFPLSEMSARRMKERELREALWQIRGAIDAYKQATDDGRVQKASNQSGYPADLRTLVEGVPNARDAGGAKVYFLRRVPRDPFADDPTLPADRTWGRRSYASPPDEPREGADVFDVFSTSARNGLNGVPYREW